MEALQYTAKDTLELKKVDIPKLTKDDEILLEVSVAGVCGTDLHIIAGDFDSAPGTTLGHEMVGKVKEAGDKVTNFKVGDRVVVNPHGHCGSCFYCTRACPHFCTNKADHASIGMKRDGGFAHFVLVPAERCHAVPQGMGDKDAILLEPYSCIMHAINRAEPIDNDAEVMVLGAGIIGILASIYLSHRGVKSVTVVELNENRRKIVDDMHLNNVRTQSPAQVGEDIKSHASDATWGYDRAFDFTGAPPAIQTGFDALRKRGRLVLFGVMRKDAKIDFRAHDLLYKEVTVTGALTNPGTMEIALATIDELTRAKLLCLQTLGVKEFRLAQYKEAFDELKTGNIAKAMLIP